MAKKRPFKVTTDHDRGRICSVYLTSGAIYLTYGEEIIQQLTPDSIEHPAKRTPAFRADHTRSFPLGGELSPDAYLALLRNVAEQIDDDVKTITIGSFGPFASLDADDFTGDYARINWTQPHQLLADVNLEEEFSRKKRRTRNKNFFINTDVNCAVIGEFFERLRTDRPPFEKQWSGDEGHDANVLFHIKYGTLLVYLLVGLGIGGGFTWGGYRVRNRMHPEIGHLQVKRLPEDPINSVCTSHDCCVTGLASTEAHIYRVLKTGDTALSERIRANYIAQVIDIITLTLAPTMIVLDFDAGSKDRSSQQRQALQAIRAAYRTASTTRDKQRFPGNTQMEDLSRYIVPPINENFVQAGIAGSFYMATHVYHINSGRTLVDR